MLWCTKLQFLKDIHNHAIRGPRRTAVVMMYKVTIFERYTQRADAVAVLHLGCYDVQSYNFWKIYTTTIKKYHLLRKLLWCTKLQFLKDIHNLVGWASPVPWVVMMYKVTIFERYTQPNSIGFDISISCYDVQSYNFWKIYTTGKSGLSLDKLLLWCTKLQFLKDIHNHFGNNHLCLVVVMMYKVTIFERYTQPLSEDAF